MTPLHATITRIIPKGVISDRVSLVARACGSGFLFDMHTAVLTNYCVETVVDTTSCPTCTPPPNDGSEGFYGFSGSWSEYMSCNNGNQPQDSRCYCEGTADRQIGHQTTGDVSPNTMGFSPKQSHSHHRR